MHFFNMEEDDLYKSMGDRTDGCYPISDEGIWHAGIHVYFTDANTPVKNPIEGKVVASCFDDEKSWNYVVTENEINLPSKKKDVKSGYHCYNLISNLRSKILPFSELSCEELKKIQPIPFFMELKTNLPATGPGFDKRNFKIFKVSLNFKQIKQNENYQIAEDEYKYLKCYETDCYLSKGTVVKIKKGDDEIEIGKYNTDYTVQGGAETEENPSIQSYRYSSSGKFIELKEDLEEADGLFILRDNNIDKDGKITIESKEPLCFWKEKKGYINKGEYPGFGIVAKKNATLWDKLVSKVRGENQRETENNKFKQFLESIPEGESFVFAVPENNKYQIFPYIGEPYNEDESYKITKADGKDVLVYYFPEDEYEYIEKKYTGLFKGKILDFNYKAEELWRDSKLTYTVMEKVKTNEKYGNFFDTIKLYDKTGKEFDSKTNFFEKEKLQSELYAKARVCLSEGKKYEFIISSNDLFHNRIFIKDTDVICSFRDTQMQNGYPASEFVEIKEGEIAVTNIEEVQKQIEEKSNYIWLKNENENIYVPKKYYESLKFQVVKSEVKKGDVIKSGDILGYPFWDSEPAENERTESKPYIDYALFFTEDITEKTTTLESINIQKDMECLIENISFTANDKKVFLSPSGCELSTKEISETKDYVELESVSYQIFVYPSGVASGYLTKDKECKLFLTTPKCKITVKNNKFDAVSSNSTEMDDSVKNCVEEFTNEIIIYMQNNQNTELGMSKDNPPQQLYKWIYKKDAQTIIKKGISANGKVQVIDTYKKNITFETAKIPKDYTETFVSTDLETITIEGKEYCKFLIENKAYYVSKNFVDQNKKNLLEEFNSKCISVNLKKNAISNNEVCPEGKLIITKENINEFKQNLIDKLSEENEDLIQYVTPVDGTEDYNIYNEKKNFYELLSKYLKRTISKHPLEWDFAKIKEDRVCESRGKPPVNEKECCDIAAGLKTADPKIFGTNSFYFVCAPYFYNKMDGLGLLEFNPYEKYNVVVPFPMKNNPGFMPEGTTKESFTQNFNAFVNDNYSHEGVDIAVLKAKIISGIYGKVIVEGDRGNYSYGCFIVIQADKLYEDKNRYFLLGHLDRDREHKKENDYVSPDEIVGYVGNTGHCVSGGHNIEGNENLELRADGRGAHLHLQMFLTDADFNDFIEDMNFNELKNEENKSDKFACSNKNIVNPFDYKETYEKDTKK